MAIKPLLAFRNPDSTLDLNTTQAKIVDRAIFDGGALTPSGTSLQITVDPFIVAGFDGMVAVSDSSATVNVPAPTAAGTLTSYLILHLEYRTLTSPIANLLVVPTSTWTSSVSNEFFITFARIDVPFGSTSLTDVGVVVDESVGDWGEKLGKTGWRSPVANFAAMPTSGNRDGDTRIALDTYVLYVYSASSGTWAPAGGVTELGETIARANELDDHVLRSFNGSGFVSSIDNDYSFGLGGRSHFGATRIPYVTQSAVANRIDLQPMHLVLNGHFVKTPFIELTLTAPAATRHDIIYIEAWRELITAPSTETYANDPTTTGTSTFVQVRTRLEQLLEQHTTPNSGFTKVELVDATTFVVTRWQISSVAGVASTSINDTLLAAPTATNLDGNAFGIASTQTDQRLWSAAAPTAYDQISWAIPLVVVRRTLSEVGPASYILETRTDTNQERFIFDVAPRADLGFGFREITTAVQSAPFSDSPSGFTKGGKSPFVLASGTVTINEPSTIVVMGEELVAGAAVSWTLPTAPAAGSRRDLLLIEANPTSHPYGDSSWFGPEVLWRYFRQGLRSPAWIGRSLSIELTSETTLSAAMVAAGYTADPNDAGLWTRSPQDFEDQAIAPTVWAIPVALVHRRNTTTYDPTTNANGDDRSSFLGLPTQAAAFPFPGEVLDLRHNILDDPGDLPSIMEETFDKLIKGQLDGRFQPQSFDPALGVVGTKLLQADKIGAAGTVGFFNPAAAPDGQRLHWSESDEAQLLSWRHFNVNVADADSSGLITWNGAGLSGKLTITAPAGYHLQVDREVTQVLGGSNPSTVFAPGDFVILANEPGSGTAEEDIRPALAFTSFSTSTDLEGNITAIDTVITLPTSSAVGTAIYIQCWAVKPNKAWGSLGTYSSNESMFAVPDRVHRVEINGNRANVGALVATVPITMAGAPPTTIITQADVLAAFPDLASAAANVRIYGIADIVLDGASIYDAGNSYSVRYVRLTDSAGLLPGFEQMGIEFTAATTATSGSVTLMVSGDLIEKWVEFNPGSKGVRGPYAWGTMTHDHLTGGSAATVPVTPLAAAEIGAASANSQSVPFSEVGLLPLGVNSFSSAFSANTAFTDAHALCYSIEATSNTFWTEPTDLTAVGFTVGNNFTFNQTSVSGAWSTSTGFGHRAVCSSVAYNSTSAADANIVTVQPITLPLEAADEMRIWYSYSPYQGITSSLENYLLGRVEAVGEQFVTTGGTNLSGTHSRNVALGRGSLNERWFGPSSFTPGSDIGYRLATGIDFTSLVSLGKTDYVREDSEGLFRPEDRPVVAPTQRLPFPVSPASGPVAPSIQDEGLLDYRGVVVSNSLDDSSHEFTKAFSVFDAVAIPNASPWLFETSGTSYRWRSQAATTSVAFPLHTIPSSSTIKSIYLDIGSLGSAGVCTVYVVRRNKSTTDTFSPVVTRIASIDAAAFYDGEKFALDDDSSVFLDPGFEYYVQVEASTSNLLVHGLRVGYETASGLSIYPATHWARIYDREQSGGTSGLASLGIGSRFEAPASWTTEYASLLSDFVTNGRVDYVGSPARGRTLRIDLTSFAVTRYGRNFYGYLPLSDTSLRDQANLQLGGPTSGSIRGLELPPAYTTPARGVYSYGTANSLPGGVMLGVPYVITSSADNRLYLGVSTSVQPLAGSIAIAPGSTIDAFQLVGRPLLKQGQ